jgi:dihydroxyacid dehydratase/phosphogluconate dehydratase
MKTMNSDEVTRGIARAPARAMLKGAGFTDADLERSLVGIANTFDVATRRLDVDTDLEARRRESPLAPRPPRYTCGVMAKYAALVSSASEGAITRADHDSKSTHEENHQ